MSPVPLSLACRDYDRTQALADGSIRPDGVDLTYLCLPVEETFFRMLRHREFDAAEMSLSSYVTGLAADPSGGPFVAVPVFPSRAFRHNGIYVHSGSGVDGPADLVGRTVGVPEYQLTAAVWIRGILADDYGVPVTSVRYRTGGMHQPGRVEKAAAEPARGVRRDADRPGPDAGRDAGHRRDRRAVRAARPASAARRPPRGTPAVRRPRAEEERYARRTGIFPIMHVVVLRRELYEQRPWLAGSL